MSFKHPIREFLHNRREKLTRRGIASALLAVFFLVIFVLFFDWLLLNWISGCCEGGICIPEWLYPQCINHQHDNGGSHD